MTVWVVDDDRSFRYVMRKMLERTGLVDTIVECTDGTDFLHQFSETDAPSAPSIIMLDLMMPRMDGWEVLEALSDWYRTGRAQPFVFVISSSIDRRDAERARTFPFVVRFTEKPVSVDKLADLLRAVPTPYI